MFPSEARLKGILPYKQMEKCIFPFFFLLKCEKKSEMGYNFFGEKMKSSASIFQPREKKSFKVIILRFTAEAAVLFGCECFSATEKHLDISLHLCKKKIQIYCISGVLPSVLLSALLMFTGKVKGRTEKKKKKSYQRHCFVEIFNLISTVEKQSTKERSCSVNSERLLYRLVML